MLPLPGFVRDAVLAGVAFRLLQDCFRQAIGSSAKSCPVRHGPRCSLAVMLACSALCRRH